MAHMNHLWSIISELSEQLSQKQVSCCVTAWPNRSGQCKLILSESVLQCSISDLLGFDRVRLSMAKLVLCFEGMVVG